MVTVKNKKVAYLAAVMVLILLTTTVLFATTYTGTFTIDNSAYVAVTAPADCNYVQVVEDAAAATTAILVKAPLTGSTAVTHPAGQTITFTGPYPRGTTVGFIKAVSAVTATIGQTAF